MVIEYQGEPEFARRQPAARTLTEAEAAELNERQAMLLPEINLGSITGTLSIRARLAGSMSVGRRLAGTLEIG
jgi:hypothetical protein